MRRLRLRGVAASRQQEGCARREGHLRAGVEERLGLEGQDGARGQPEGLCAARGTPAPGGRHQGQHEEERPPHGNAPAGEQGVETRGDERTPERQPPRVGAGREGGAARRHPTQDHVEEAGRDGEIQARDREEVRDPEPRERLLGGATEAAPVAESQRGQEGAARSRLAQRPRRPGAEGMDRAQRAQPLGILAPRVEGGMHQLAHRADPRPRERALTVANARVAKAARRPQPHPRPQPIARERILDRIDTRRCRLALEPHTLRDAYADGLDRRHPREIEPPAPLEALDGRDRAFEGDLDATRGPRARGGVEPPSESRRARARSEEERERRARAARA